MSNEERAPEGTEGIEASDDAEVNPSGHRRLISAALVGTLLLAVLCALMAIAWFAFTEPDKPSVVAATPTAAQTPDDQSLGFRGDPRSPSQIIRAARRAQERSVADQASTP